MTFSYFHPLTISGHFCEIVDPDRPIKWDDDDPLPAAPTPISRELTQRHGTYFNVPDDAPVAQVPQPNLLFCHRLIA